MMVLFDILGIVGWGTVLLVLVWTLIVDRLNLSFIEIDAQGILMRTPFLKVRTASFKHDFHFREKKGRIRKLVTYDEHNEKRMVVGNGFELSLQDLKTMVEQKNKGGHPADKSLWR